MPVLTQRSRPDDRVPTSSMADIAFLLLIFFLVTTVFPKDAGLAIVLPQPGDVQEVPPENLLQLLVLPDGLVEVRRGEARRGDRVRPDRVEAIWRSAAASNDRLVAVIRTHPDARYEAMTDVLDALKKARANRISLQLLEEGR